MKELILYVTIPLLVKSQEELNLLLKEGYKTKEFNKINYLIKLNKNEAT